MPPTFRCLGAALAALGLGAARLPAQPVALWLFDEPESVPIGQQLADTASTVYNIRLEKGGRLVPGRYGRALRPQPGQGLVATNRLSGVPGEAVSPGEGGLSPLDLGPRDWTLEAWLRLDAGAEEGTVLELGAGRFGESELVVRLTVSPRERAAFLTVPIVPRGQGGLLTRRVEYPVADGPPQGAAWVETVALGVGEGGWPRERWFHLAVVHAAATLRLYLDGQPAGAATVALAGLPAGGRCISVGSDARGRRRLAGAIDELRLSARAVYEREFAPPGSFASAGR